MVSLWRSPDGSPNQRIVGCACREDVVQSRLMTTEYEERLVGWKEAERGEEGGQSVRQTDSRRPLPAVVRWLKGRDLRHVAAIEQNSFAEPRTEEQLLEYLGDENRKAMVAEHGEHVIGYLIFECRRDVGEMEVLSMAVAERARRRRVATELLRSLREVAGSGFRRIKALIRESNLAAQLLLRAHGFRATAIFRQAYAEPDEDGYVMEHRCHRGRRRRRYSDSQ